MKKYNIFKILTIAILVSVVLGYFIPSTSISYGAAEKGTINPVTLLDIFTNLVYSANVFIPLFVYILVIGAFYAVLYKTGSYEKLINNVAFKFNKNKGLFIVLTVLILGIVTFFTGEIYTMLVFIPFLISVVRKLGYSKETSIVSTIGAVLLGSGATLYTYYANQILNLTVKDNVLSKVILLFVALVSLIAFILVFGKKPESTKELKKEEKAKTLPLRIIMWLIFVLLILGFVNWNGYFGFEGFDKFLETLRSGKVAKVSVFDIIVGKTIVAFGTWQVFNAAVLFIFVTVLFKFIYKIKINDFFESYASGLKKAFPYAMIVIIANIVLVNVAYSGIFYTMIVGLTKKSVTLFNGTITSILTAFFCPDIVNGTQFALYSASLTKATEYQNLLSIVFQSMYSLFLLISPTSVLLLLGLRFTETRYKDWMKYIWKFFLVLFITLLVTITICVEGFKAVNIVALVLLVIALVLITYLRVSKVTKSIKKEVKKETKEVKKVEVKKAPAKKTTTKKAPAKKTTTKKTNKK